MFSGAWGRISTRIAGWSTLSRSKRMNYKATDYDSAHETLARAEGLLKTKGWIKGEYQNDYGYCLLGAIEKANGGGQALAIRLVLNCTGTYDIEGWNDRPGTALSDIMTVLAAAKNIAKEHIES